MFKPEKKIQKNTGQRAEQFAANYLSEHNVKIIEKNFHCRFGEIDLIALDGDTLVFIEVKYRARENRMSVFETIDKHKCRKIITTSTYYLSQNQRFNAMHCRYDVVGITGQPSAASIEWIKNAFQA